MLMIVLKLKSIYNKNNIVLINVMRIMLFILIKIENNVMIVVCIILIKVLNIVQNNVKEIINIKFQKKDHIVLKIVM